MTVYLEPFICTNLLMNFMILFLCQRCAGISAKYLRTFLSALTGCIYSFISVIYEYAWIAGVPARFICALIMTAQVLPFTQFSLYLRLLLSFTLCTFLLGGTGFGIMFMMGAGGFKLWMALICCIICLVFIYFLLGRKRYSQIASSKTALIIKCGSNELKMTALIDSGNLLTEPITGLPIIVCTDISLVHYLTNTNLTLPYTGAGGSGIYTLYKADAVYKEEKGKNKRLLDAYIAFETKTGQNLDFQLIVPPSLFI